MFFSSIGGSYSVCEIHVSCVMQAYSSQEYGYGVCSVQLGRTVD